MARQVKRLSARSVATLSKPGKHADGDGLYLRGSRNGGPREPVPPEHAELLHFSMFDGQPRSDREQWGQRTYGKARTDAVRLPSFRARGPGDRQWFALWRIRPGSKEPR